MTRVEELTAKIAQKEAEQKARADARREIAKLKKAAAVRALADKQAEKQFTDLVKQQRAALAKARKMALAEKERKKKDRKAKKSLYNQKYYLQRKARAEEEARYKAVSSKEAIMDSVEDLFRELKAIPAQGDDGPLTYASDYECPDTPDTPDTPEIPDTPPAPQTEEMPEEEAVTEEPETEEETEDVEEEPKEKPKNRGGRPGFSELTPEDDRLAFQEMIRRFRDGNVNAAIMTWRQIQDPREKLDIYLKIAALVTPKPGAGDSDSGLSSFAQAMKKYRTEAESRENRRE